MESEKSIETKEFQENRNVNINQNSPEILTNNIYTSPDSFMGFCDFFCLCQFSVEPGGKSC